VYPFEFSLYSRRPWRARAARSFLAAVGLGSLVAGCSTSIPLPSMVSLDDVTGSIEKPVASLASTLDPEDWRRAQGALGVALDPQGNGAAVNWDNPQSGVRGSFTPVGAAYPSGDDICRAFLADIGGKAAPRQLQGVGCREKGGEWRISDLKPWKKI
jgi:surface antigen